MSSFEEIGALLGFVAFAGLAVLVFLTFQQGRHLRRLRDWAGRAPERAAALAARDRSPEGAEEAEEVSEAELEQVSVLEPSRFEIMRESARQRWSEIDRRMPVDPKILLGGVAAIVLGVAIATGGFGLLGGDGNGGGTQGERSANNQGGGGGGGNRAEGNQGERSNRPTEVAVLNGTAPPGGTGVPGIADRVSTDVEEAGFEVGTVDNAGSFTSSTVMWTGSSEAETEAQELADSLSGLLGTVEVVEMTPEIEPLADGAPVALIIGQDDATI